MQVVFTNIKWDTDGEIPDMELPTEFAVEVKDKKQAMQVINHEIGNLLSDQYEYCVDSIGGAEIYDDNGNLVYDDEFGEYVNEVEGQVS